MRERPVGYTGGQTNSRSNYMSQRAGNHCRIEGSVAPGFESVKQLYEHKMRTLAEKSTQLCVYYNGEKVVDLWASVTDEPNATRLRTIRVWGSVPSARKCETMGSGRPST